MRCTTEEAEAMKRSTQRILTTHTGSLPRPAALLELVRASAKGEPVERRAFEAQVQSAVRETVKKQAEAGIDVVSDGEMSKPGFFNYVRFRLNGIEPADQPRFQMAEPFPGYNAWRAQQTGATGGLLFEGRPACVGPLSWRDKAAIETDIANFKAALATVAAEEAFVPSASIGIIAQRIPNRCYPTYERYVEALAEVMREEYLAIAKAGFILQIDAPEMGIDRHQPEFHDRPFEDFQKRMNLWVGALNEALAGIPEEQVRFHVCWGNGEGPHTYDVPLGDIVGSVLQVTAEAYSVEASNPRHEHEWKHWRDVPLPAGKILIPGVIDSTTNFVEHPEVVADRILNFAGVVGRENVIAGTDCGFGTSADSATVYPPIAWAKLATLAEGARLASKQLWN
jgi:5-methyltetrahydropteroyltriglutamate--homocysteine methyltransferase